MLPADKSKVKQELLQTQHWTGPQHVLIRSTGTQTDTKKSYKYLLTAFTSKVQWHSDLKETQICITRMEIFPPEEVWMLSQWSMPRRVPASHRKPRNLWLVKPFSDKILSTLVYLLIGKRQTEPDSKIYISPRSPNRRIILDTGGHGTATIRENRWLPFHQWEFNETLPDRNRKQK